MSTGSTPILFSFEKPEYRPPVAANISSHGGECCGVSHVYNFYGDVTVKDTMTDMEDRLEEMAGDVERDCSCPICERARKRLEEAGIGGAHGHLFEAVLTDDQMGRYGKDLREAGWKVVARWFNSNSGNMCNMLIWTNSENDIANCP